MSESITVPRYDQFQPSLNKKSSEPFAFDTIEQPGLVINPEAIKGADTPELAVTTTEGQIPLDQDGERLIFPDKRGNFEINLPAQPRVESTMLDDAWREQVEARQAAARQEAEAHAEELELNQSLGANAQAIVATRDYSLQYGMDAGSESAAAKKTSIFGKITKLVTGAEPEPKVAVGRFRKLNQRDLIRTESKVGATVFGEIPANHRREFFALDANTLVWYEEYVDEATGQRREMTTRYELHPHGVLKVQDGQPYTVVEGEELRNLAIASRMARERVMREVYGRDPVTGQLLTSSAATI